MKLDIKLQNKVIGNLEVSTIPGVSARFELNNAIYKIIKTNETSIDVELYRQKIEPSQETQVK